MRRKRKVDIFQSYRTNADTILIFVESSNTAYSVTGNDEDTLSAVVFYGVTYDDCEYIMDIVDYFPRGDRNKVINVCEHCDISLDQLDADLESVENNMGGFPELMMSYGLIKGYDADIDPYGVMLDLFN